MSILNKLASALDRRDEVPNQELAKQIAAKKDKDAVKELVENLSNKNKDIQSDCIKVLYEIGAIDPSLIAAYYKDFLTLLDSKNNRLQWGAMTALSSITSENPKAIAASLSKIMAAADKGSVITKDHAVNILIRLCSLKEYADNAFALLNEQLLKSPTNQLPMYAENAMSVISEKNKKKFIQTLTSRLDDIDKDTKRKRVEKVIKKVSGTK
jgi:HEAT repeat protein